MLGAEEAVEEKRLCRVELGENLVFLLDDMQVLLNDLLLGLNSRDG